MMKHANTSFSRAAMIVLAAGMLAVPALAQPTSATKSTSNGKDTMVRGSARQPQAMQKTAAAVPKTAAFSDPAIAAAARLLSGCWKASLPGAGDVVMGIAPVTIDGATDTLYAEVCRGDSLNRPFRQSIWQLQRTGDTITLRTMEFSAEKGAPEQLIGMWAAPEVFPPSVGMNDVRMTMEIPLTKTSKGYSGKTTKSFPTDVAGATQMTGEITFDGNAITTSDRGMDASGAMVWGPPAGQGYTFTKFDGGPKVTRGEDGLVIIDYGKMEGEAAKPGERITVQYIGYLENGKRFDSSYERGSPFTYTKGDKLIEGFNRAMADAHRGTIRRIIIPASLALSDGTYRGKVPANSTLIYDINVLNVSPPEAVRPMNGNAMQPTLQPVDPNDPALKKMQEETQRRLEARAKALKEKQKDGEPAPK